MQTINIPLTSVQEIRAHASTVIDGIQSIQGLNSGELAETYEGEREDIFADIDDSVGVIVEAVNGFNMTPVDDEDISVLLGRYAMYQSTEAALNDFVDELVNEGHIC